MKNIQCIPVCIAVILFFFVISCSKDAPNVSPVNLPCTNCAAPSSPPPKPTSYWHSLQITSFDWAPDSAGLLRCDLDPKVSALFPWDYGTYSYPYLAFDYGTSKMQIISQGDSVTWNGGLFFLKGSGIIFKAQTASPPDTMYVAVYLHREG